jgi:hypothetical protein
MVGEFLGPMRVFVGPKFSAVFVIVPRLARAVLMVMRMRVRVFVRMGMLVFVTVCHIPVRVLMGVHMLVFVPMLMFVFMGVLHVCLLATNSIESVTIPEDKWKRTGEPVRR